MHVARKFRSLIFSKRHCLKPSALSSSKTLWAIAELCFLLPLSKKSYLKQPKAEI